MAKDIFHNTVKTALQKDGWIITHDPYKLRLKGACNGTEIFAIDTTGN
jgi:XisH protein